MKETITFSLTTIDENEEEKNTSNELDDDNLFLNNINADEDFLVTKSPIRYGERNEINLNVRDSLLSQYNHLFFKPAKTELEKKFNAVLDAIRPALKI